MTTDFVGLNCQAQVRSPKVQSPKVKTKKVLRVKVAQVLHVQEEVYQSTLTFRSSSQTPRCP